MFGEFISVATALENLWFLSLALSTHFHNVRFDLAKENSIKFDASRLAGGTSRPADNNTTPNQQGPIDEENGPPLIPS